MAKKILIFSTSYYPFVAGAEVAVKEITDRITNIEFDLITARFDAKLPKFEKVGNVNVYRLGFGVSTLDKLILPFWGAFVVLWLNWKKKYDLFWCIMATFASGAAYIANILHFWKSVPIILSLQEGDSEDHFERRWFGLINLSWWLALKNTNKLTVLSSYLKERAERFGYKGKIEIVPNGVDIKKFDVELSKEERLKIREELGLKEGDMALVTTSRLMVKNGVGDVIKSLSLLPKNLKFVIFGEGYLKESLELLAESLGVGDQVIFKGFISHADMPKYLKSCDIFIRPSLSEGFGNSFIEAMAARLPVIATPVGGIPDFLQDGVTGYFCEPGNPKSVASVINRVVSDVGVNRVIETAYKMVVEKYDWDLVAKKMQEVFNKILR